jgi:hypothetical protein
MVLNGLCPNHDTLILLERRRVDEAEEPTDVAKDTLAEGHGDVSGREGTDSRKGWQPRSM